MRILISPFCLLHFFSSVTSGSHVRSSDYTWPPALLFSRSDRMRTCEGGQWGVKADTRHANCSDLFWWFTYLISVSASSPWGQRRSETQLLLPPSVGKKRTPVLLCVCSKKKKIWSDLEVWSNLDIFSFSVKRKLPESRNGNRLHRGAYRTVSFNLCDSLLIKS